MAYPIIGVSTYRAKNPHRDPILALQQAYVNALIKAGGIPWLIPSCLDETTYPLLISRMDGFLFTGGGDIAIDRFNGEPHPLIHDLDTDRDEFELSFLKYLVNHGIPFLGICRGLQVISVGLGGSLFTHIKDQLPDALKHDYYPSFPRSYLAHKVRIKSGTRLEKILGNSELSVNSLHHQGVRDVPDMLEPSAFAPDGLVEAVELTGHPFGFAVQWHPEWLPDNDAMQRLFKAFIDAAKRKCD